MMWNDNDTEIDKHQENASVALDFAFYKWFKYYVQQIGHKLPDDHSTLLFIT